MPRMEELLRLVNEAGSRTARIQALAASMGTTQEHTLDDYDANLLSAHLEIAIDNLRTVQEMASYLFRPIKETSRLWKNGSGQYETTAGFLFREGSPIEVLVPDKCRLDSSHWERTYLRYDGKDYYVCRICPVEDLIAALPEHVTADNADGVRAQLDHILDLYRELNEDEQAEINLSRIYALQGALDAANAPMQAAEEVTINIATVKTLTAEDGGCQGHTFTGKAQTATIYVKSGTHDVTFSGLNITETANVGVALGATMNLTIEGANTIKSSEAGIYVPVGATLVINGNGSLNVSGGVGGAGIGGATYVPDGYSSEGDPNCGTVEIKGGTVTATGGRGCAGIGGGSGADYSPGNGGTVTISGGTVTAAGGVDSSGKCGGAGIGGSAGESDGSYPGSGGTLTISGGHVTLTAGNSTSYGFGQATGKAPGGTCELTLTDASYLAEGTTLDPNGKYTADGTALSGPPTNAGDYTVTFSLDPNDTYTGSRTLSFTVAKASITITADDKRADVGAAKPALTYTVTGLVSGDTLATAPTLACDADMNTIGQYPITASGAAVPSGGNYNTTITYVAGMLNVTDPTISVTGVTLNKTSTTLTVGGSERLTATVAPSDATDKSVIWASSNTAVATVDTNGTVTAVSAGTATITVTTADGAKTATCTVTVRTNSSGGGSYVPSGPGSSTITVPVSGDKSTVHVSASVSGTTATVSKIDTSQIENVIGDNGQASMVEIDFTGLGKTIDTVKLPAAAIKDIAAKAQNEEVGGLTVKLPEAEISFDANALSAIQAQAGSQITLTVTPAKPADLNSRQKEAVGSAPVFDLTLRSSSGAITDFRGGYATVSLPYTLAAGQNPSGVVVYYLDNTGNITPCTTMYDVRGKSAIFTTGHLSLYFVGYDPAAVWVNPFSDVAEGAWYYDAVRYASENGLMGGYGNGLFGPNDTLTRAQFAQILYNKEGRPAVTGGGIFTDVAPSVWCAPAITWAAERGIVGGYGNGMFGPNDNITREQLAVMLWRYAGSPAATDKELHFNDADKASGYALDALRWAVENGIINGKGGGILDPKGLATRAQTAQMLKNFIESQEDNA